MKKLTLLLGLLTLTSCKTTTGPYEITLRRPMMQNTTDTIVKLKMAVMKDRNITLNIDSTGGLVDYFKALEKVIAANQDKITCRITGMAVSAAFLTFAACDNRIIEDHALLMFHKVRISTPFYTIHDTDKVPKTLPPEQRIRMQLIINDLKRLNYKYFNYVVKRLGIKKIKLFKKYFIAEKFMTKEEFRNLQRD